MKKYLTLFIAVFYAICASGQGSTKLVRGGKDYEKIHVTHGWPVYKTVFMDRFKLSVYTGNKKAAKKRIEEKLRMYAAMVGANIASVSDQEAVGQRSTANSGGGATDSIMAAAYVTGDALATGVPDFDSFVKKAGDKKSFSTFEKISFRIDDNNPGLKTGSFVKNFVL